MKIDSLPVGQIRTNCYIVSDESTHRAFIVDPGDEADRIAAFIERSGLKPEVILLTHGHFDHILAASELAQLYGIQIYAYEEEAALLADPVMNCSRDVGCERSVVPDVLLQDGVTLDPAGISVQIMHTPGHTRGSMCIYCADAHVLISGDTLFRECVGRTDLPTGNAHRIVESVRRLAELPEDTLVYPGHGETTRISYERRNNPYMRENTYMMD